MRKILLLIGFLATTANGQVGIGTTLPQAALDITSTTNGVLVPRVALTSKTVAAPVVNPQTGVIPDGTLIWNTATVGTSPNFTLVPGFYYWESGSWNSLAGTGGKDWSTTGNTGTASGTNFIGTTDNQALTIRTGNTNRFLFTTAGRLQSYSNGTAGSPAYSFTNDVFSGIYLPSTSNLGFSTNGVERFRIPNANQVHAMSLGTVSLPFYSFNSDPNTGIWSPSADILAFSTNGVETMRINTNSRIGMNFTGAPIGQLHVSSNFATVLASLGTFYSKNSNVNGTGIVGIGQNGTDNALVLGSGGAFSGDTTGSYHFTTNAGIAQSIIMQDAFGANWLAGHWTGAAYRKILGTGTVSTIVKDLNDEFVIMNCPETPENLFMDYGIGKLQNGKVHVLIDPILSKNIIVNESHPLKVFIQLEGDCNGVYVTNKSSTGFDVVELNSGSSNTSFSYSIVATMGDQSVTAKDGSIRVGKYDKRWEKAPEFQENTLSKR